MKYLIPLVLIATAANGQCIPVPTPIDSYSGLDGAVFSSVVFDDGTGPALYLGGSFGLAGSGLAANIVKWNGEGFVPLGTGSGRTVRSIAVDGNSLLAEGGSPGAVLRRWQNGVWTSLSPTLGVGSQINVIRPMADGIYVGARTGTGFTADANLQVLRDGLWSTVGNSVTGEVIALERMGDRWIVGGRITHVGGTSGIDVNSIAAWDGTQWSVIGAGFDGAVHTICIVNNEIVAGGSFEASDGQAVTCVGRFDGTRWREVGNGLEGPVYHLSQINGELVAAGGFTKSNGTQLDHVAKFVNGGWEPISGGINGDVRTLAQFAGKLYAGGDFTRADEKPALRVASLSNGRWSGLLSGINGTVSALTKYQDRLIVSGSFSQVGGVNARRMAAFDGDSWSQFGNDAGFSANCFVEFGEQLLAGGAFSIPGGPSGVAVFNGATWDAMGALEGNVKGMHVHDGVLYAYGNGLLRQSPGGQPYYGLAKWDGTSWVNGFPGTNRSVAVNALETFNGRLYMAGDSLGTLVGVWDLSGLEPVPAAQAANSRYALKSFNGQLYIGGGLPVLAAWTGTSTVPINTAQSSGTQAITEHFEIHGGRLYAIGWFPPAGSSPTATTVLRIVDGQTVLAPKTGFPAAVGSYQPTITGQSFGSRLYVGGSFKFMSATATSSNSSAFLSSLVCQCFADFNNDGVVDSFDYLDFLLPFSVGYGTADINTDGVVDFFDYLDFVAAMSAGC